MSGIERIRSFARSPHHAWLGLLTLGAGLASLSVFGAVVGAAAYALGWIYLPDSALFRRWLDRRSNHAERDQLRDFLFERRRIYDSLGEEGRHLYDTLAADIESLISEFKRDTRLDKALVAQRSARLTHLGWTYLRLLNTREMLDRFLNSEEPATLRREIDELGVAISSLNAATQAPLIESKQARLDSLKARFDRHQEARHNLELTLAERERIVDLVKLYRADHLASRDAGTLTHEIDGAARSLDRTRDWLRDLEFDTSPSDIPEELTADAPVAIQ